MSSFNRLAVYGHRGWASSGIVAGLIRSGAPVKILHRPGSDTSQLPQASNYTKVEVDVDNQAALVSALQDVDILISLVGQPDVKKQFRFIEAIPKTGVKLFSPSELAYRTEKDSVRGTALADKVDVVDAAKAAGIPTTLIWPGCFAESSLAVPLLGVDLQGNRIVYSGDSENQQLNICTRDYVAAAYASIFAQTPISTLQNRTIGLSEIRATGSQIAAALAKKHNGSPPQIFRQTLAYIDEEGPRRLAKGDRSGLAFAYRRPWATGEVVELVGDDIWDVEGYEKETLEGLIGEGRLAPYKELPPPMMEGILKTIG